MKKWILCDMGYKGRFRYDNRITIDWFRRSLEMLGLGAVVSLALRLILISVSVSFKASIALNMTFCGIFQIVNIWLCRKSNRRMRHFRSWYYLSNLMACALYALLGGCFLLYLGFEKFMQFFGITLCFAVKQSVTLNEIMMAYGLFILLTAVVIVLAKETKYIIRMFKR